MVFLRDLAAAVATLGGLGKVAPAKKGADYTLYNSWGAFPSGKKAVTGLKSHCDFKRLGENRVCTCLALL